MRRFFSGVTVVAFLAAGALVSSGLAEACSLDNAPSLYADGQRDQLNPQPPTNSAQLATWAPFILPHDYMVGHTIVFTEDRSEVAKSLVPEAMLRPWRWHFGDGNTAFGWTVHHAYTRPGHWLVTVDAYLPSTKQWYKFDQVTVALLAASHAQRG